MGAFEISRKRSSSTPNVKTSPASKSAAPEIYASHGKIEERAFQMFEDRGSNHGNDLQDWLLAENQLTDPQIPAR